LSEVGSGRRTEVDFVDAIERAVGSCEALIVVIGREWLTVKDKGGRRRLDDPGDFVHLEVAALARRSRVIPVLAQDTPMPSVEDLPPSFARLARRSRRRSIRREPCLAFPSTRPEAGAAVSGAVRWRVRAINGAQVSSAWSVMTPKNQTVGGLTF
jgi:hypothetical protein